MPIICCPRCTHSLHDEPVEVGGFLPATGRPADCPRCPVCTAQRLQKARQAAE